MSSQWQETPHLTHLHIRLFDFHIKLGLPVAAFSPLDCPWAYNNHSLSVNNSFKPSLLRNWHLSATYWCINLHTYTLCTLFSAQASLVDPLLIIRPFHYLPCARFSIPLPLAQSTCHFCEPYFLFSKSVVPITLLHRNLIHNRAQYYTLPFVNDLHSHHHST